MQTLNLSIQNKFIQYLFISLNSLQNRRISPSKYSLAVILVELKDNTYISHAKKFLHFRKAILWIITIYNSSYDSLFHFEYLYGLNHKRYGQTTWTMHFPLMSFFWICCTTNGNNMARARIRSWLPEIQMRKYLGSAWMEIRDNKTNCSVTQKPNPNASDYIPCFKST